MTQPLAPPEGSPQRTRSCLEYVEHDGAKAFQTCHVSVWPFAQVVAFAQGDCLQPTVVHPESDHFLEAHLSPLHHEAALGSFGEALPVGLVNGAQETLGEHM